MEVHSANGVFENCGARTRCRLLQRKTDSKMLRRTGSEPWCSTSALREAFYNRVGEFPAKIPAAKDVGPTTIS